MRKPARKRRGLRKVILQPAFILPLLHEVGVIVPEGEPESAHGYLDKSGQPRRIIARYANGWRADLRIHADGSYALKQSLTLKVGGSPA